MIELPGHPFPDLLGGIAIPAGVEFNAPPPHLIADAIAHVTTQMAQVPAGSHGAIVVVGNLRGINAAIATKGPFGTQIVAWVGKSWNGPIDFELTGIKVF